LFHLIGWVRAARREFGPQSSDHSGQCGPVGMRRRKLLQFAAKVRENGFLGSGIKLHRNSLIAGGHDQGA
jgi:hypothetical protein